MELSEIFRRIVRNASMIIGGRVVFGLVNLGSSAIAVQTVGLEIFGVVVLLQAYTRLFVEVLKFESWQAVISYGTGPFLEDPQMFRRLLGVTISIDAISMIVGVCAALAFMPWAADLYDWPAEVAAFAPIYVLIIPFIMHASPNGVLRLLDRVDVLVSQHAINAIVRFVGVAACWWLDLGVMGLVLAWFLGAIISGLLPIVLGFVLLRRRGLLPIFRLNLLASAREFSGIWRFLAFSNASSSIGFVYNSGLAMFVGATLGASSAATLQIAQQFARALGRPVRLLGPIISPEFARLAALGEWAKFRKLIMRQLGVTALGITVFSVLLFALLDPLLAALYTDMILEHIWLFRLLIISALLSMISFAFEPAMLSANKPGTLLLIRSSLAVVFVAMMLALLETIGLIAVGFGSLTVQSLFIVLSLTIGGRLVSKRIRLAGASQAQD